MPRFGRPLANVGTFDKQSGHDLRKRRAIEFRTCIACIRWRDGQSAVVLPSDCGPCGLGRLGPTTCTDCTLPYRSATDQLDLRSKWRLANGSAWDSQRKKPHHGLLQTLCPAKWMAISLLKVRWFSDWPNLQRHFISNTLRLSHSSV